MLGRRWLGACSLGQFQRPRWHPSANGCDAPSWPSRRCVHWSREPTKIVDAAWPWLQPHLAKLAIGAKPGSGAGVWLHPPCPSPADPKRCRGCHGAAHRACKNRVGRCVLSPWRVGTRCARHPQTPTNRCCSPRVRGWIGLGRQSRCANPPGCRTRQKSGRGWPCFKLSARWQWPCKHGRCFGC